MRMKKYIIIMLILFSLFLPKETHSSYIEKTGRFPDGSLKCILLTSVETLMPFNSSGYEDESGFYGIHFPIEYTLKDFGFGLELTYYFSSYLFEFSYNDNLYSEKKALYTASIELFSRYYFSHFKYSSGFIQVGSGILNSTFDHSEGDYVDVEIKNNNSIFLHTAFGWAFYFSNKTTDNTFFGLELLLHFNYFPAINIGYKYGLNNKTINESTFSINYRGFGIGFGLFLFYDID